MYGIDMNYSTATKFSTFLQSRVNLHDHNFTIFLARRPSTRPLAQSALISDCMSSSHHCHDASTRPAFAGFTVLHIAPPHRVHYTNTQTTPVQIVQLSQNATQFSNTSTPQRTVSLKRSLIWASWQTAPHTHRGARTCRAEIVHVATSFSLPIRD